MMHDWDHLIKQYDTLYYRAMYGEQLLPALLAMRQFEEGMQQLQSMAGHSQEHIGQISQALLDMAQEEQIDDD